MTTAREAFLAYCTRYCYEPDDRFYAFWQAGRDSMREEIEPLYHHPTVAQSEPVAWGVRSFDGVIRDCISPDSHNAHPGAYTIPLYTHPKEQA